MCTVLRVALALGVAFFSLTACQSGDQAQSAQAKPELTARDTNFLNSAAILGLDQVAFAQLVATKTKEAELHAFAATTVADFTKINQELATLARSKGLEPPTDMDGRHQVLEHQLEGLNGNAFERGYTESQLQDLTLTIQAFQNESDSGSDPQVRSFAKQYLPLLQEHLQMAIKLRNL